MAGVLRHKFVSAKPDGTDTSKVQPSNWNDDHAFATGALGSLLIRDTAATDGASWLADVATGSVLVSGGVGAAPTWSTDVPRLSAPNAFSVAGANSFTRTTDGNALDIKNTFATLTGEVLTVHASRAATGSYYLMNLYANNVSQFLVNGKGDVTMAGLITVSGGVAMATWPTTANAANAYVADGGSLSRSTSSLRYKTDVERLDMATAKAVVSALSPITYRGIHDGATRFAGFAAEEVATVDPVLVTYDAQGRPDYVTYDRIPAYLVPVAQDHETRIAALEARLGSHA